MKSLLLVPVLLMVVAGCSGGSDPEVKPQVALNPGGKPRSQVEATTAKQYEEAGAKADAQMEAAAAAMKQHGGK